MTDITELDHVRAEIRAEIQLLNSRLNALISSQSFLVIAYGSVLSAAFGNWHSPFTISLPPFFSALGAALVLEARPALRAAEEAITHWRHREEALINQNRDLERFTLAVDEGSRRRMELRQHAGRVFSSRAPIILLIAWAVFFMLPFALYAWA